MSEAEQGPKYAVLRVGGGLLVAPLAPPPSAGVDTVARVQVLGSDTEVPTESIMNAAQLSALLRDPERVAALIAAPAPAVARPCPRPPAVPEGSMPLSASPSPPGARAAAHPAHGGVAPPPAAAPAAAPPPPAAAAAAVMAQSSATPPAPAGTADDGVQVCAQGYC